jgi:CRP/FNR family transcriptional regulator
VLDPHVRAALAATRFATLPDHVLERLTAGSTFVDVPAGGVVLRVETTSPFVGVVVEGFLRTYIVAENGRQLTVRYSRPGDVVGLGSLYSAQRPGIGLGAIVDSHVLLLRPDTVRASARAEPDVADALLSDLAERTSSYMHALASTTLSTLRQNLVRHLLDVAAEDQRDSRLVARLSQQELADHVGSVREVVGRILRDLRDEGLVTTGRDEIVLLDPARLHDLTWPRAY